MRRIFIGSIVLCLVIVLTVGTFAANTDPKVHNAAELLSALVPQASARYGVPFTPGQAMRGNMPATVDGSCTAGTEYTIKREVDMRNQVAELECIFNAAIIPDKVPKGVYYGEVLSFLNTGLFGSIIQNLWRGKLGTSVVCNGRELDVAFNIVGSKPVLPGVLSIGGLPLKLASGEYIDGRGGLILDYSQDLAILCPDSINLFYGNKPLNFFFMNPPYPFNQIWDVIRIVGRAPDGGLIWLGKSWMTDAFHKDREAVTIAYWSIITYDADVRKDFLIGQSLPPLPAHFVYRYPGLTDFAFRFFGMDNLVRSPVLTLKRFLELVRSFRVGSASLTSQGAVKGVGRITENTIRLQKYLVASLSAILSQSPAPQLFGGLLGGWVPLTGGAGTTLFGLGGKSVESVLHEDTQSDGSQDGKKFVMSAGKEEKSSTLKESITDLWASLLKDPKSAAERLVEELALPTSLIFADGSETSRVGTSDLIASVSSTLKEVLLNGEVVAVGEGQSATGGTIA